MSAYAQQARTDAQLEQLHGELADRGFMPGWNRHGNPPMWPDPAGSFQPARWDYATARSMLARAGDLVSPELSERRNLILVNPHEGNRYPTVRTQVLAYQMIKPGERARTHRHSPHAGRLVLDADEGAYTVVDGVRLPMRSGDVLLTPGWMWHGHGHEGNEPAYWIDFLDVPLVHLLEPMFFEPHPDGWMEPERETRESALLFPYDVVSPRLDQSPVDPAGFFGRRLALGDPALPTIGLTMHRFDPGTSTRVLQTTANYQYCVVEGSGRSWIDGVEVTWARGDVVVVPCWSEQRHESADGATLLAVTDEPLQRYCGYLRTADDIARGDGRHVPIGAPAALQPSEAFSRPDPSRSTSRVD